LANVIFLISEALSSHLFGKHCNNTFPSFGCQWLISNVAVVSVGALAGYLVEALSHALSILINDLQKSIYLSLEYAFASSNTNNYCRSIVLFNILPTRGHQF
jgi:hypothetical protein